MHEGAERLAARGTSRPRAARHGECATETRRHREFLGFLRVSVPLWPMALCLAGRVNFHHGLLGYLSEAQANELETEVKRVGAPLAGLIRSTRTASAAQFGAVIVVIGLIAW